MTIPMMNSESSRYIVSGRVPGDDNDTVADFWVTADLSPIEYFIEEVLYGRQIPHDWKVRAPTKSENRYGDWAYISQVIEI